MSRYRVIPNRLPAPQIMAARTAQPLPILQKRLGVIDPPGRGGAARLALVGFLVEGIKHRLGARKARIARSDDRLSLGQRGARFRIGDFQLERQALFGHHPR